MTLPVTDIRSNDQDQIAYAAKQLQRAAHRILVFEKIHSGKQKVKTVTQLVRETDLTRKRVLEEGKDLANRHIVVQTERDGDIAYERDAFYYVHRKEILDKAKNPDKLKSYATKYTGSLPSTNVVVIRVPRSSLNVATITIDGIDSFFKARNIATAPALSGMSEAKFKKGIKKILGEQGRFQDWGGERSDLYTTRLKINGVRHHAAIAFKGKATQGILTPKKMGKNADQVQRLFTEPAEVFLIQYHGQIGSAILQQMADAAASKSFSTGRKILYGVIDGADSAKLVAAYPRVFK